MASWSLGSVVAAALLLGALCQWLAWYLRKPAILFLLIAGIAIGALLGTPAQFGIADEVLLALISLGVAIILFEGGLTLHLAEVSDIKRIVRNLVTVGVVVTTLAMALAGRLLLDLPWPVALLFGAVVSVTGPTVIVPLLRTLQPSRRVGNTLRWEGIIVDPVGAIIAVLIYAVIISGQQTNTAAALGLTLLSGIGLGIGGALVLGTGIKRHWAPEFLLNYLSLAIVVVVFQVANYFAHESGLLAVTVMGIALANMRDVNMHSILNFKEHLSLVLISLMFLALAARMDLNDFVGLGWSAVALVLVAQFIVRPLAVAASSIGTSINLREGALLSWIAPRGIVAAAVSSVFAVGMAEQGIAGAERLAPAVFVMIVGTVLIQSLTARPIATWLGLAEPGGQGIFIIGANRVSITLAQALQKHDIRVLLADDNWNGINEARLAGVDCFFGSALSDHADLHLDLSGLTKLLIVSGRPELSALAFTHFRPEFGQENIYALETSTESASSSKRILALPLRARSLFGKKVSWHKLASALSQGATIRSTKITEEFSIDDYRERHGGAAIPLFCVDKNQQLRVLSDQSQLPSEPDWLLIALVSEGSSVDR